MVRELIQQIVEHRDLEMYFMPIVRFWCEGGISRWSLFAFEALIRGPKDSVLRRPDDLFVAADEAGLRERLELMCLETAFERLPEIPESALLFLNVGAETFLSPGFDALIERWYARIDPSRIVFEIVEGEVPSVSRFRRQMERGMVQGFRYALDDLPADGEALRRMVEAGPVAFLKIDRSFVLRWNEDRRGTRDWLSFVSDLATAVRAEIVLEGVESPLLDSLPDLSSLGVRLAQGFLFGEPAILAQGFQSWRRGFWRERLGSRGPDQVLEVVSAAAASRIRALLPGRARPTIR